MEIAFDKIATAYDAVRAHPPEIAAQVGRAIVATCGNGVRILELGVGTGRIALPVAAAGGQVVGVDIALEMLRVASEKAGDEEIGRWGASHANGNAQDVNQAPNLLISQSPISFLQADISQLPFTTASFDAALAVHVLHLLPDWRAGLAEIVRVIRPGGRLVQGNDWRDPESCVGMLRGQLRRLAMELLPGARPPGAGAAIPQALSRLGGTTAEPQVVASWLRPLSPAQILSGMAARVDAETWAMPDEVLHEAIERLSAWALEQWGDLGVEQQVEHRFLLTVTHFEGE
jgi:ubiquinone/menaquinone biosynthesis C-methylase UbiE